MVPQTRQQFKEFIMRKLGEPVLHIEVDDSQIEDRIDTAIEYYGMYHFDGSKLVYFKQLITPEVMTNHCFPLPQNVIGAVEVFSMGALYSSGNFFNIQYQVALNDLYQLTSQSIVPYFMAFQNIELLEQMLVGQKPIRYNRREGMLYIDMDWTYVAEGNWIIVKAYQTLDPTEFPDVWASRWLQEYAEALIGTQWATNLSKYKNIPMPGGMVFNADQLLNRYLSQKNKLEEEMIGSYSYPISGMMG